MKNRPWIKFLIFIAVIIMAFVVCLQDFFVFAMILIGISIIMAGLAVLAIRYNVRWAAAALEYVGFTSAAVGNNNNYRFFILAGLTVASLFAGFFFGGGEPLFVSTLRYTSSEIIAPLYSEGAQETTNSVLFGLKKNNAELNREKEFIQFLKKGGTKYFVPPASRNGESKEDYNQKIRNHIVYGTFVDDKQISQWLGDFIPADFKVRAEQRKEEKSWLFWKLAFLFLFMTAIYLPFAFADETARWLRAASDWIRERHAEYKTSVTPPSAPTAPAGGTIPVASSPLKKGWSLLSKLYASDMLAEFTIRVLESLARFFTR